jgi:hypothetical protein
VLRKESSMADLGRVTLEVQQVPDGDTDQLVELTGLLRAELLEFVVDSVEPVKEVSGPNHAKVWAMMAGWLAVQLGNCRAAPCVARCRLRVGCAHTHPEVQVSYGGDVLKDSGVTAEQQEKIVDAWLARHAPGS